ncbi:MAG TPA: TonB-dependent receptor [Candidatus Polarisedimenticolia bacterium]|nr:TonB-dependent receptor [Candidatus Polarisedimenticolia bacterium]
MLAAGLAAAEVVSAQQPTTGSFVASVTDQTGAPVAEAKLTVAGPLGQRVVTADDNGRVEIRLLPAGDYRVQVEKPGFGTIVIEEVTVAAGERTWLPIVLTTGYTEEIEVTGAAPLVDMKRTEVVTTFKTDEVISTLPVGREFTDLARLAPGVVPGHGTGELNHSIGGSSGLENAYIIDGTNITSVGFGSVGTGLFGRTISTGIGLDFLEELQVKTAGFEAEYGQALGGVINGVVKSGGNAFTGSIRFFFQPADLEAPGEEIVIEGGATQVEDRERTDVSVQAGGPFIKDKLFWFVALNPVHDSSLVFRDAPTTTNPVLAFDPGAAETYPYAELQPPEALDGRRDDQRRFNYAAKVTWQVSPRHRLELSGFGDESRGDGSLGIGAGNPFNLAGDLDGDGTLDVTKTAAGYLDGALRTDAEYGSGHQALRYSAVFGPNWFFESQISHRHSRFEATSVVDDYPYTDERIIRGAGIDFIPRGGGGLPASSDEEAWDAALKFTGILGRHEVKAGYEYWDAEYEQILGGKHVDLPFPIDTNADGVVDSTTVIRSPTGTMVTVIGGIPGCTACSSQIPSYESFTFLNPSGPTNSQEHSLFVQDTWSIGRRWVAKLGARATRQSLEGSGDFTLNLSFVAPDVFTTDPTRFEPVSYTFETEISPRLGLTFDPRADGRTKLYVNAARYFERVPLDLAAHAFSNDIIVLNFPFRDPDLTVRNPESSILMTALLPTRVEKNTRLPYVDEFVVGWQQLLSADLMFEIRAILRDQGRVLEDVQSTSAEEFLNFSLGPDAGGNLPFPGFGSAPLGQYVVTNPGRNTPKDVAYPFADPEREYKALELVLEKRLSKRWQLIGNYRYSSLRGNYEGLFRNDNGQGNPNFTTLFDFPDSPLMRGQFITGPLNLDRPHVLHVLGTRFFDGGFEVGGAVQWMSGLLRTPMLIHPAYLSNNEVPGVDPVYRIWDGVAGQSTFMASNEPQQRGSLGRAPSITTFDLHVAYGVPLGRTSLKVGVDVFNVFNSQHATTFNDTLELGMGVPNPNYGRVNGYEQPRTVRIATIWGW